MAPRSAASISIWHHDQQLICQYGTTISSFYLNMAPRSAASISIWHHDQQLLSQYGTTISSLYINMAPRSAAYMSIWHHDQQLLFQYGTTISSFYLNMAPRSAAYMSIWHHDQQLLSQCGTTYDCLSQSYASVPLEYSRTNSCFPSRPLMLLCGFESRFWLESSGFGMWHFLKLVARGFLRVLRFPPLLHRLMVQPMK